MRIICLSNCLFLVLCCNCAFGRGLELELRPRIIDIGRIPLSQKNVECTFDIVNLSNNREVLFLQPTCNCIVLKEDVFIIHPLDRKRVTVVLKNNKEGLLYGKIRLLGENGQYNNDVLEIVGECISDAEYNERKYPWLLQGVGFEKNKIDVGKINSNMYGSFSIYNSSRDTVSIGYEYDKGLNLRIINDPILPGQKTEVRYNINPGELKRGRNILSSRFISEDRSKLEIQFEVVNLYNRIDRVSTTKCPRIHFNAYKYEYSFNKKGGNPGILSIPVINDGNDVLKIDNVDSKSEALTFKYKTYIYPKEESEILVKIDKEKLLEAKQKLVITVYSDCKEQSIANLIITASK